MVAANMGLAGVSVGVTVEGDLDLRGTLGTPSVSVGFEAIRVRFRVDGDKIPEERLAKLIERTERYCVVLQTLLRPPAIETRWEGDSTALS
jgi:OsmC-like protein.